MAGRVPRSHIGWYAIYWSTHVTGPEPAIGLDDFADNATVEGNLLSFFIPANLHSKSTGRQRNFPQWS